MAGNTKLIGFMQGSKVRLERWGEKADVEIGVPAVEALVSVCRHSLPSAPEAIASSKLKEGSAYYDEGRDEIVLTMTPTMAEFLGETLKSAEFDELNPGLVSLLDLELSSAMRDRERCLSPQEEPGLE